MMLRSSFGSRFALAPALAVLVRLSPTCSGAQDLLKPLSHWSVRTTDAQATVVVEQNQASIRVRTGHEHPWPGITIRASETVWDLSRYNVVSVSAKNTGSQAITLNVRVDNPGADGTRHCVTGSQTIEPGREGTVRVPLRRTSYDRLNGRLFGMRGYPVRSGGDRTIQAQNVSQFLVFLDHPRVDYSFEIVGASATGSYTPPTSWTADADPFLPLIDTLGQYRHRIWPGKTLSVEDLERARRREAAELSTTSDPTGWNRFGGWAAGPQLKATGFFRVQQREGRWWLVDPEGRLFWSQGIDCVRMLGATPIDEREAWFEDPPWTQPEFGEFLIPSAFTLKGHYAGRSPRSFSFAGANLKRKYGPEWKQLSAKVVHRRLRAWGINTIANWSDRAVARMRLTPYTDNLGSRGARMIEGSEGYWGKFPDVFDPSFLQRLRQSMAAKRGHSAGDPWCIGYFSHNEMSWGNEVSLALATLSSPPDQPAKQALINDLQARHPTIDDLNDVWGTHYSSWDALAASTETPDANRAAGDLRAFYTRTADRYFQTVREVIKEVAPNQLYLGCRFARANPLAAASAASHCDVVSYNLYRRSVADFSPEGVGDVPLLIGEFHFGALDRGLFHTGLVAVEHQAARAKAYTDYIHGALNQPRFVGAHWFQYQDEPTTGRVYDEENYQIGFVDVADTPYLEMISASRFLGEHLYDFRANSR